MLKLKKSFKIYENLVNFLLGQIHTTRDFVVIALDIDRSDNLLYKSQRVFTLKSGKVFYGKSPEDLVSKNGDRIDTYDISLMNSNEEKIEWKVRDGWYVIGDPMSGFGEMFKYIEDKNGKVVRGERLGRWIA